MKKKKVLSMLLALLLVLSLAACGSGGSSGGNSGSAQSASSAPSTTDSKADDYWSMETGELGWDNGYDMPEEPGAAPDSGTGSSLPANTKMIYSADLSLETTEFDEAERALDGIVDSLGGWFENRSIYQGGGYRNLRCTVRVPAIGFTAFLDQAGEAAHVTSRDEYAEDVSEAYYDQESRLATQRTKLERLQLLLSRAEAMEDIIQLESAISDTELEIEHLTGSLRKYDSLVGYSTITLQLREVYQLSNVEPAAITFGQRLSSALSVGLNHGIIIIEDFCIAIARNWLMLTLFAAIITAAVLIYRRQWRKKFNWKPSKKAKPSPPPEAPADKDENQ